MLIMALKWETLAKKRKLLAIDVFQRSLFLEFLFQLFFKLEKRHQVCASVS